MLLLTRDPAIHTHTTLTHTQARYDSDSDTIQVDMATRKAHMQTPQYGEAHTTHT